MKTIMVLGCMLIGMVACSGIVLPPQVTPSTQAVVITPTPPSSGLEKIDNPQLLSIKMFDENNGWGVMENQIARTSDGGSSWHSAMPEGSHRSGYITAAYFLDQEQAWFISSDPDHDPDIGRLFHTMDGGLTWVSNETPFNGGSLMFLDKQNGWVMADLGAGAGSQAIGVYITNDGGITWENTYTNDPTRAGASDTLPLGGIKGGLVPLDMNTAFIWGVYYAPGSVYLYRTDDGGRNWKKASLDLPGYARDEDLAVEQMQVINEQVGYLAIRITSREMEGILYSTHDGGDKWELMPRSAAPCRALVFVSTIEGITYCDGPFYVTRNGAKTWTTIQPNAAFNEAFAGMDFVNLKIGWVITRNDDGRQGLYKTIDGGSTWTVIYGPPLSDFGLSLEQIRNAPYRLGARDEQATIRLNNGSHESGTDPASPDFANVSVTRFFATGDLNDDGLKEAAAVIVENYGGTGTFAYLTVYELKDGEPIFLSSILIDDRPLINQLTIKQNKIVIDAVIHGAGDPGCCPNFPVKESYGLTKSGLTLLHFVSWTPGGAERSITIDSPANGKIVSGSVEVEGSFTVSPFENSLAYRIHDAAGKELTSGPITVQTEPGGPGVFNQVIDLSTMPAGLILRLEIQDLSAADGSLLAMDSVEFVVK